MFWCVSMRWSAFEMNQINIILGEIQYERCALASFAYEFFSQTTIRAMHFKVFGHTFYLFSRFWSSWELFWAKTKIFICSHNLNRRKIFLSIKIWTEKYFITRRYCFIFESCKRFSKVGPFPNPFYFFLSSNQVPKIIWSDFICSSGDNRTDKR